MRIPTSCSVRRYRVEGALPSPESAEFSKRLRDRRFLPLRANEERTYGWVSADNLLVTDFGADALVRRGKGVVAVRIDRRRVNARLLRARFELEMKARAKANRDGAGPGRIGRDERLRLRKDLHQALLRETSPSVEAHTVLVDATTRTVSVLTLSKPANEVVRALFRDTFGADLAPLTPWRRGTELLDGRPEAGTFETLERSEFAPGGSDVTFGLRRRGVASAAESADAVRDALREEVRP
jgi:DNA recombination-dependent growth factor C